MPEMAWYYDLTDDKRYCGEFDPDGSTIAWLCSQCADDAGDDVQFASAPEFHDGACWNCGLVPEDCGSED